MIGHIERIRAAFPAYMDSVVKIFVERNLGFEAEHHERALRGVAGVEFYHDDRAKRFGILTTQPIKHAMVQLTDNMLREGRLEFQRPFVSLNESHVKQTLRDQMVVYSYQFKQAIDTFQKDRIALSGKVGGMRDDICIALQLACYFTDLCIRGVI